jgi:Beta-propeller repeat
VTLNCVWGKSVARVRILLAVALLMAGAVALSLISPRLSTGSNPQVGASFSAFSPLASRSPQQIQGGYGQLPLAFEPNRGQTDPQVKFMARGSGFGLFLTSQEAVLKLARSSSALRMSLASGNPKAEVVGTDTLPGKSNYLIGKDPSRWHTNIPQFARVRYSQIYPGIDLIYYGKQGKLEYDFEVAPGADPAQVALKFQGADKLSLDANGDLVLEVNGGKMRLEAPRVYQTAGGAQKAIDGKFVMQANRQVGFEIGAYDRTRTLVIDPVLAYSTYLGGSGNEFSPSVAVDAGFNAYVAGTTASADFPIVEAPAPTPVGALQSCFNDSAQPQPDPCPDMGSATDVFVAKFDASGSALLYSTYLGGSSDDSAGGVAVDSGFNAVVVGTTRSNDFPVVNAYQSSQGSSTAQHVFITKIDPAGQRPLYSTYLSGSGSETATGVAVDSKNKIYVTGTTTSTDFPVSTDAFQSTPRATNQFFVSKIDTTKSTTSTLTYSTYFGGGIPSNGVAIGGGIAVDTNSAIYITGATNFQYFGGDPTLDFPIVNAFQSCLDGPTNPAPCPSNVTQTDAFVAKLDPTKAIGSHLVYSTYLGGSGNDVGTGISVVSGNAYVTGTTDSPDIPLPTSTTAFQQCLGTPTNPTGGNPCPTVAGNDAYLAKLSTFDTGTNTTGTVTIQYFSYIGGSGDDQGLAVVADTTSTAHLTGSTASDDFHQNPLPSGATYEGGGDAFVTLIDTTNSVPDSPRNISTYLGGSGTDRGTGIAVDSNGATYVVGETLSANFPKMNPFQGSLSGGQDAFVSKLGPKVNLQMTATATPNPVGVGSAVTFKFTIKNLGDTVPSMVLVNNTPIAATATLGTLPSGCGGSAPTITCTLPLLVADGTQDISFTFTPASGTNGFADSANIISPGTASANASVSVTDFNLALNPNSATVKAGQAATYTATVSPSAATGFPNSVSLACSGLPTGASCSVANGSITNLNSGPQSRAIVVNTTMRTTTTTELRTHGPVFAVWFPVSGLAFLGLGIGGTMSRKRRAVLGLLIGSFFVLMFLQAGCGSKTSSTSVTTGTPAGKYTFTVTATSGTVSRSQIATIEVQ